eukprot:2387604-Rhodomonas_salina.2
MLAPLQPSRTRFVQLHWFRVSTSADVPREVNDMSNSVRELARERNFPQTSAPPVPNGQPIWRTCRLSLACRTAPNANERLSSSPPKSISLLSAPVREWTNDAALLPLNVRFSFNVSAVNHLAASASAMPGSNRTHVLVLDIA